MRNVIILDLDGVLITTPSWKADLVHLDGYSAFNEKCVDYFNLLETNAEIWLSSTRRTRKSLVEFKEIFKNRNVFKDLTGFIPNIQRNRNEEIKYFLELNKNIKNYLIIDDDITLSGYYSNKEWTQTLPLLGFTNEKYLEASKIIKCWT